MYELKAVQKLQSFQQLLGKVTHAVQREGSIIVLLDEIVQTRTEAFKDQTIVLGGQSEAIVHDGIQRQTTSAASVDVLHNVGLDEGAVIIPLDVAHELDGDPIGPLSVDGIDVTLLGIDAFHHAPKGTKSHILDDAVAIGHHGAWSALEVPDGIIPIGRIITGR